MELFERIRTEPDLYYAWQANIAMAFKDEANRHMKRKFQSNRSPHLSKQDLHEIANQAARNFLDLLIKPIEQ
jgi:hypothetical protein